MSGAGLQRVEPGARFSRYQILSRLAIGGMAEVWLAVFSSVRGFRKQVVVKTMLPHLAVHPGVVDMFIREAALGARLSHPNIVHVSDFGELDGRYFICMEYLPGRTMREVHRRLRDQQQLAPLPFVAGVVARVCDAVQHMHDFVGDDLHGLLHNDLSPENVMITFTGATKVIDLGAAAPTGTPPLGKSIVGKFCYLAPERISGRETDRRSDVYSLGVVLYELATGARPFDGDDASVIAQIVRGGPPDPRRRNPALPEDVARIILRAMARDPADRYPEARLLGEDLLRTVRGPRPAEGDELGRYMRTLFNCPEATPPFAEVFLPPAGGEPNLDEEEDIEIIEEPVTPLTPISELFAQAGPRHATMAIADLFESATRAPVASPPPVRGWHVEENPRAQAVACFDRGLSLIAQKMYQAASAEWERACALDPENRTYQADLNRLKKFLPAGETKEGKEPW